MSRCALVDVDVDVADQQAGLVAHHGRAAGDLDVGELAERDERLPRRRRGPDAASGRGAAAPSTPPGAGHRCRQRPSRRACRRRQRRPSQVHGGRRTSRRATRQRRAATAAARRVHALRQAIVGHRLAPGRSPVLAAGASQRALRPHRARHRRRPSPPPAAAASRDQHAAQRLDVAAQVLRIAHVDREAVAPLDRRRRSACRRSALSMTRCDVGDAQAVARERVGLAGRCPGTDRPGSARRARCASPGSAPAGARARRRPSRPRRGRCRTP